MLLFISGAEIVFVFFIVLLVFGADKISSIARTLAKGMTQVKQEEEERIDFKVRNILGYETKVILSIWIKCF